MSEEIIKVLDNLSERFGVAIDWTSANIMPYLQDLVQRMGTYKFATAVLGAVISTIILIIAIIVLIKAIKWAKSEDFNIDDEITLVFIVAFSVTAIVVSIPFMIYNSVKIIKYKYIPESAIIEYIQEIKY